MVKYSRHTCDWILWKYTEIYLNYSLVKWCWPWKKKKGLMLLVQTSEIASTPTQSIPLSFILLIDALQKIYFAYICISSLLTTPYEERGFNITIQSFQAIDKIYQSTFRIETHPRFHGVEGCWKSLRWTQNMSWYVINIYIEIGCVTNYLGVSHRLFVVI